LHNDHCENDCKCENASIFVHQKELERIHDPHPLDYRYLEDYIVDAEENGQIKALTEEKELFPGISVLHTPAHTEGGLTILVDTPNGKAAITGFCVIMENFNPPKEILALDMDIIPPGTHVNVYESYDIMERVKEAADILLPLHEPKFASIDTIP
jgi:N-acyl homoserine lactone hydrolase